MKCFGSIRTIDFNLDRTNIVTSKQNLCKKIPTSSFCQNTFVLKLKSYFCFEESWFDKLALFRTIWRKTCWLTQESSEKNKNVKTKGKFEITEITINSSFKMTSNQSTGVAIYQPSPTPVIRPKTSILDKSLSRGKQEVSLSGKSFTHRNWTPSSKFKLIFFFQHLPYCFLKWFNIAKVVPQQFQNCKVNFMH